MFDLATVTFLVSIPLHILTKNVTQCFPTDSHNSQGSYKTRDVKDMNDIPGKNNVTVHGKVFEI